MTQVVTVPILAIGDRARWMGAAWSGIAVVAVALIAFGLSDQLGGSGFIACFVGGLTYGGITRGRIEANDSLAVDLGSAGAQVSFLLVGAVVLGPALQVATWQVWAVAAIAYLGWFGPRGLATITFAVLVVDEADLHGTGVIVTVAAVTVGLSVYAHGSPPRPAPTATPTGPRARGAPTSSPRRAPSTSTPVDGGSATRPPTGPTGGPPVRAERRGPIPTPTDPDRCRTAGSATGCGPVQSRFMAAAASISRST